MARITQITVATFGSIGADGALYPLEFFFFSLSCLLRSAASRCAASRKRRSLSLHEAHNPPIGPVSVPHLGHLPIFFLSFRQFRFISLSGTLPSRLWYRKRLHHRE